MGHHLSRQRVPHVSHPYWERESGVRSLTEPTQHMSPCSLRVALPCTQQCSCRPLRSHFKQRCRVSRETSTPVLCFPVNITPGGQSHHHSMVLQPKLPWSSPHIRDGLFSVEPGTLHSLLDLTQIKLSHLSSLLTLFLVTLLYRWGNKGIRKEGQLLRRTVALGNHP